MARARAPATVCVTPSGRSADGVRAATPPQDDTLVSPQLHDDVDVDTEPPANNGLRALAFVLLVIPIVALLWVGSYAKEQPAVGGFPFFFWYQFAWIFVTSALTWVAYKIVLV